MISAQASEGSRERYVQNIMRMRNSATAEQEVRGRTWYRTAHDLADLIGDGNARMGAGVLAALSANKRWADNVRLAVRAVRTGEPSGSFKDALGKAARILSGEDPAQVLPMHLKTGNFFAAIANPDDPEAVVVDRHAHDIAVGQVNGSGDRGLTHPPRYRLLADAYREAARRLGEPPSTTQAITWVVHTERLAGTGTRGALNAVTVGGRVFFEPPV
ncbi:hypothetical protein ABGB09_34105 [Streptomyces sp. B8F3]|uniref:DUF7178 family protein n=1 Tax=Streptomyces sp. B8F3 TaxID=3153573 RepID=UPI00325D5E21